MSKKQNINVSIGGNVSSSNLVAGNKNSVVSGEQSVKSETVDLKQVAQALASIRATFEEVKAETPLEVVESFDQIDQELTKPEPDKEVVGSLLEKAIKAANKVDGYVTAMKGAVPSIMTVVGWLGASWQHLAGLVVG